MIEQVYNILVISSYMRKMIVVQITYFYFLKRKNATVE